MQYAHCTYILFSIEPNKVYPLLEERHFLNNYCPRRTLFSTGSREHSGRLLTQRLGTAGPRPCRPLRETRRRRRIVLENARAAKKRVKRGEDEIRPTELRAQIASSSAGTRSADGRRRR